MENMAIGVDIGGTHVTAGIVDFEQDRLIPETLRREHIDPSGSPQEIIATWKHIISDVAGSLGKKPARVGIAMPGPFDYAEGISLIRGLHKYENLYGLNIKDLLASALGIQKTAIRFVNDASAFLLGEMHCGAAKGYKNLVCITLGTGLGSAAFFNGKPEEGDLYKTPWLNAYAEDYLSSRWIVSEYVKRGGEKLAGAKEVAERVSTDRNAAEIFHEFGSQLGAVLLHRYKDPRPELVVIGGNIAKAWDSFIPATKEKFREANVDIILKPAELGEKAALIGSSYLFES